MPSETDKLVGAVASNALPGIFQQGFQQKYPGFITTTGRGNGYYNAMYEMEQRQFNAARGSALAADAEQASRTIVGMFITAAKMCGKDLSDEQLVKIQESARFHGSNIETYISIARMLGLSEQAIDYIRQAFYGDKGSTTHLFDTTYNVMRSKVGSGAALRQAQQLATYQFGAGWSRRMTGGLNADQYAATQAFMIQNGGMAGQDLKSTDGYAMIDNRHTTSFLRSNYARIGGDGGKGVPIGQLVEENYNEQFVNGPLASRNQQALKMASNAYLQELKKMNYAQLRRATQGQISDEAASSMDKLNDLDKMVGKIKEDYRLKVDRSEKDLKKQKKALQTQLKENIKKAEEAGDEEAVKQLKEYGQKIVDSMDDIYHTGMKNSKGEELNAFDVSSNVESKLGSIADEQIAKLNKIYHKTSTAIEAREMKRAKLLSSGVSKDSAEIKQLDSEINELQAQKHAIRDSSPAGKHVAALYGNSDKAMRVEAVGNLASQIQNAMAASGKPISTEEALQASKALMPMNASTQDMRAMTEQITQKLAGVVDRNGSVEQFLLQMSSGRNIAEKYGLTGLSGTIVAGIGTNANQYAAQYGLTDAAARGVADDLTEKAAQRDRLGAQVAIATELDKDAGISQEAMNKLSPERQEKFKKLMDKVRTDPGSVTEEEGSELEGYLSEMGLTRAEDYEADAVAAKRAKAHNKGAYEATLAGAVRRSQFEEINNTIAADSRFKLASPESGRNVSKMFVKNANKLNEILEKRQGDRETAYQMFLAEQLDSGEITEEEYNALNEDFKKNKTQTVESMWRSAGFTNDETRNQAMVAYETMDNYQRDTELASISQQAQNVFSATDKNAYSKLIDIVGSDEYKNADDKKKAQMLTEGFGTQLSTMQKKTLAYQMVQTGKLSSGMAYTDANGEEAYLSNGQIAIAEKAMRGGKKFWEQVDKLGAEGTMEIDGEKYTAAEIRKAVEATESAAGKAVGLGNGEFSLNELEEEEEVKDENGETVKRNKFFAQADDEKQKQIEGQLDRVIALTDQGYKNYKFDAYKNAKTDEEKQKIKQQMIADIMADPEKAKEYGIDSDLAERERRANKNKEVSSFGKMLGYGYDLNNMDQEVQSWDKEGMEAKKKKDDADSRKVSDGMLLKQDKTNEILERTEALLTRIDGKLN